MSHVGSGSVVFACAIIAVMPLCGVDSVKCRQDRGCIWIEGLGQETVDLTVTGSQCKKRSKKFFMAWR